MRISSACLFLVSASISFFPHWVPAGELEAKFEAKSSMISIHRAGGEKPILTQHARADHRPYLHPIVAPDGKGILTEYSPGHHKHQTGLYWGFTRVNGRDYFHHPAENYWKRKSVQVVKAKGETVSWQTVYELLDAAGKAVLQETQIWQMRVGDDEYSIDLTWQGTGVTDVTIGEYKYGGLFLRMPWKRGLQGDVVNSSGKRNGEAEGQRDVWCDVGMQIDGRDDLGHIAIFDHPKNKGFPLPWRVDGQLGIGPVRARLGEWHIKKEATETIRHRFVVYAGKRNAERLNVKWAEYAGMKEKPPIEKLLSAARQREQQSNPLWLIAQTLAKTENTETRKALLRGILRGLAGRRNVAPPDGWAVVNASLSASNDQELRELSRQLSQIFGDRNAAAQAITTVKDTNAAVGTRRSALRSLLNQQNREASYLLERLLDEPLLAIDAIRGYATVENATAPAILLERFESMPQGQRRAVVETLASRKRYAVFLLDAVKRQAISREEIPAHVARSLNNLLGEQFVKVFGKVKPIAQDRAKLMAKYRSLLTADSVKKADAPRGRAVFKKTCASCHLLYGEGAKIGPDLTGSNRANLDYILLNSVDPSYDVPDAYKMVTIATNDGRVLNGIIAEEDATRVVLKTVEQPRVTIVKEDIDIRKVSRKSMMPDGQFEKMKPQELLDLIKYLRTTEQVEIAQ